MPVGARAYDLMYRWWAPWDSVGVRDDLRALLDTGLVSPRTHPRALDLGCGTGANVAYLAEQGYEATGVDFSAVALHKARTRADHAGVANRCRFVEADLTRVPLPGVDGLFDLVVDFGTLDDLRGGKRRALSANVAALTRPGGIFLLWCFYGARMELPLISFHGPSRLAPGIEPGEVDDLFGATFHIERFQATPAWRFITAFLLRRSEEPAPQLDLPSEVNAAG